MLFQKHFDFLCNAEFTGKNLFKEGKKKGTSKKLFLDFSITQAVHDQCTKHVSPKSGRKDSKHYKTAFKTSLRFPYYIFRNIILLQTTAPIVLYNEVSELQMGKKKKKTPDGLRNLTLCFNYAV